MDAGQFLGSQRLGGGPVITQTNLQTRKLRCPATGLGLTLHGLDSAEAIVGPLQARVGSPFGRTDFVLLRADLKAAYPIRDGIPILLTPEILTTEVVQHDLRDPRWSEAYEEMDFYNGEAETEVSAAVVRQFVGYSHVGPFPSARWLDAPYDAASQLDAFNHLGPATGRRVAQLGGSGQHAVKSLLAGASEAWLVTPMHEEAVFGRELASRVGVGDRFNAVVGIGEQIPIRSELFDGVYAGGCLHHMASDYAAAEIYRVLAPGGRFAAVEPWQTHLHHYGTRLVGKREANPYCRPLNDERISALRDAFESVTLAHHGPLLRYLELAFAKITKRHLSVPAGLRLTRIDDRLPLPAQLGGSVAVLAARSEAIRW